MNYFFYAIGFLAFITCICHLSIVQNSINDISIVLEMILCVISIGFGYLIQLANKFYKLMDNSTYTNNEPGTQKEKSELTSVEKGKKIVLVLVILFIILLLIASVS